MATTDFCVSIFNVKEQIRLLEILTLPIEFHRETPEAGALNVSSASLFDAFLRSPTYNEEVKLGRYNFKIKEYRAI